MTSDQQYEFMSNLRHRIDFEFPWLSTCIVRSPLSLQLADNVRTHLHFDNDCSAIHYYQYNRSSEIVENPKHTFIKLADPEFLSKLFLVIEDHHVTGNH